MIWATIMRFVMTPGGVAAIGVLAAFGAFKVGEFMGYRDGVNAQKTAQFEADVAATEEIRERVRNALAEIGADTDDTDIDAVLRRLSGDAASDD